MHSEPLKEFEIFSYLNAIKHKKIETPPPIFSHHPKYTHQTNIKLVFITIQSNTKIETPTLVDFLTTRKSPQKVFGTIGHTKCNQTQP
jgi:hypothetical protein